MQPKASAFNFTNSPMLNFPKTTPSPTLFGVAPIPRVNLPRSIGAGLRYAF